ncbi:unnamed protein product [Parascedosporium putredinis]|uniref:FAD/NAD(P)-binding domain-containing protein n=1 Tax=Parascedosporium putredinis TaxID=1442378 RepID=A0A9P1ME04_9PEZI|nr:unnamed protein product [Parascedosporium putredinis]CAI8001714.1 unnamed protein product [Parascedosporium putredinis]
MIVNRMQFSALDTQHAFITSFCLSSKIIEPVRDPKARIKHIQAKARSVDFARKVVTFPAGDLEQSRVGEVFDIPYDKLVIAVGAVTKTFDTPGVKENAIFFKDIGDAQRVKREYGSVLN